MNYGSKLKNMRTARKLTQFELGKKSGVGITTITRFEQDQELPSYVIRAKLVKALDTTHKDLWGSDR